MAKFYVRSGAFKAVLDRPSAFTAAVDAFKRMKEDPVDELGSLTVVNEHGFETEDEDDCYLSTVDLLDQTGLLEEFMSAEEVQDG